MTSRRSLFAVCGVAAVALALPLAAQKSGVKPKPRLSMLDQNTISYIRPGLVVKVVSAAITTDGMITARVKVTDPKGIPLDMDGINTPGPISIRLIAAYIPA